jgi:hypothetical protein
LIHNLLDAWEKPYDYETAKLATTQFVFALAANAYRAGRAALLLWEHNWWTESVPLVRACLESAIYAAWTQQTGSKAVEAAANERARQNRALLRSAIDVHIAIPQEVRDDIERQANRSGRKLGRAEQAKSMEKMCQAMSGGKGLYLMYRHLSGAAHASGSLIRHLGSGPDGEVEPMITPLPSELLRSVSSSAVAYSLVWAGRGLFRNNPSQGEQACPARCGQEPRSVCDLAA